MQEPSAPATEAPNTPMLGLRAPNIVNCSAPTASAKAEVVAQPEMSTPGPSSDSDLAPEAGPVAQLRLNVHGPTIECMCARPKRGAPVVRELHLNASEKECEEHRRDT
eukprot:scaffold260883_cov25-Tisochrysis_lutea.AAC.2